MHQQKNDIIITKPQIVFSKTIHKTLNFVSSLQPICVFVSKFKQFGHICVLQLWTCVCIIEFNGPNIWKQTFALVAYIWITLVQWTSKGF